MINRYYTDTPDQDIDIMTTEMDEELSNGLDPEDKITQ